MTKEEAICRIREHKIVHRMNEPRAIYISEALEMAIKALEQEPCEDCISRHAVLTLAKEECDTAIIPYRKFVKGVNALPPVNPQEPILDNIRAEIMRKDGLEEALEIIDKYMSER